MPVRIKCWTAPFSDNFPPDQRVRGMWLKDADIERFNGRGAIVFTDDPAQAMTFGTAKEAFEYTMQSPKCHPVRSTDGLPNRPLRAYTTMMEIFNDDRSSG